MTITVKYERKDFFGRRIYTEDTKKDIERSDLEKALRLLKSNSSVALDINGDWILYWDSTKDYDDGILTVKQKTDFDWEISRMAFSFVKKCIMDRFKIVGDKTTIEKINSRLIEIETLLEDEGLSDKESSMLQAEALILTNELIRLELNNN